MSELGVVWTACGGDVFKSFDEWASGVDGCPHCDAALRDEAGILGFLPSRIEAKEIKEAERAGWESLAVAGDTEIGEATVSDDSFHALAERQFDFVFGGGLLQVEDRMGLDIGGGWGWLTHRLGEMGAETVLGDYNASATCGLARAKALYSNTRNFPAFQLDAEALPFHDEQFDFAVSCSFLHHLPNPKKAVEGIWRVLKREGVYVAMCEAFCPFWMSPSNCVNANEAVVEFRKIGINEQVFLQREYVEWLRDAGFAVSLINPAWDEVVDGELMMSRKLKNGSRRPEILGRRAAEGSVAAKVLLGSGVWKLAVPWMRMETVRNAVLSATRKHRVIVARKAR